MSNPKLHWTFLFTIYAYGFVVGNYGKINIIPYVVSTDDFKGLVDPGSYLI